MVLILISIMILLAFVMEVIDTSLGMMYGTLLSPILIGFGFHPLIVVPAILIPGLLVVFFGVFIAVNISSLWVKTYIGILVIIMSIFCLSPIRYKFAWWKHYAVGILAAFNKALSRGGFRPVTSTCGIIGGLKSKVSIATTTFAEVYICLGAFVVYLFFIGFLDTVLVYSLCFCALIGGVIGPYISSRISHDPLKKCIGILGLLAGVWLLWNLII